VWLEAGSSRHQQLSPLYTGGEYRNQDDHASVRIRQTVQPLLAQLKRPNPQQRERATELLYEADSIDTHVQEQSKRQNQALAACTPAAAAEVLVTEHIFSATIVIFGDKMAAIRQERQGAIKLARRQVERVEEIILFEPATGLTATLANHEYSPLMPPVA
jgi:hypothetical protein